MARKLKVYGILTSHNIPGIGYRQCRTIVAATSKKAAAEAMGMTDYEFNRYGSVTGNEYELELALGSPGTVFVETIPWRRDRSLSVWEEMPIRG